MDDEELINFNGLGIIKQELFFSTVYNTAFYANAEYVSADLRRGLTAFTLKV